MEPVFKRQSSQIFSSLPRPIRERTYAHSVTGGAGGGGIRISTASDGMRVGSGFGGGYDYQLAGCVSGNLAIGNEKQTMQHLNDRLASYLEMVRNLEKANSVLEIKIKDAVEKRGPLEGRDYGKYNAIIKELRDKIIEMITVNAKISISVDNLRLTSEDFKVKMEYEMAMRQTVEADVAGLRKILDDTNVVRMHLESDIESMREELIHLRKNHETDVDELRAQLSYDVKVDVDANKGQDLAQVMEEMRASYEKIALKNQEDLKACHESQISEVQGKVAEQSEALNEATTVVTETRKKYQKQDIDLQAALGLKASLEANLRDTEMRYNMELEKYNAIILKLQEELTRLLADIRNSTQEYEQLLNLKVKLEAEIAEYRRLLDGSADFKLEDALDKKVVQTQVVTVTQTLVDGKVVKESKDIKPGGSKVLM